MTCEVYFPVYLQSTFPMGNIFVRYFESRLWWGVLPHAAEIAQVFPLSSELRIWAA
jgi:hypothetical protein